MKKIIGIIIALSFLQNSNAQIGSVFKGDETDTIYFVELDTFSISARPLNNYNFLRYEGIVKRVYPYADTAVMYFNELNALSFDKKKDEKKYKKELEDKLRDNFEGTLKNLSKSQGEVLIDIIERNTGRTMYDILKEVKNGTTAFWWQNLSRIYGYDLKEGYDPENDPTLESIIVEYEKKYKHK
ncbi:MAG: DUF4294 domain-containing protein [Chitinophagales bacterium]